MPSRTARAGIGLPGQSDNDVLRIQHAGGFPNLTALGAQKYAAVHVAEAGAFWEGAINMPDITRQVIALTEAILQVVAAV